MKKYLIIATIFLGVIFVLPSNAYSQYTGWNTPLNNYVRYNMNNRIIRNAAAKRQANRKAVRRNAHKKRVHVKSRGVSMLENIIEQKFRIDSNLPNKSLIV